MAKSLQNDVENILAPFKVAIGGKYPQVCNQVASMLGRLQVTTIDGDWQCSARGILSTKDTHKAAMPLNDARSILVRFGLQLGKLSKDGDFKIDADIPKVCIAFVEKVESVKTEIPATS